MCHATDAAFEAAFGEASVVTWGLPTLWFSQLAVTVVGSQTTISTSTVDTVMLDDETIVGDSSEVQGELRYE